MKNFKFIYIYSVFIALIISSCVPISTNITIRQRQLPQTFDGSKDSSGIGSVNWREYFRDSMLCYLIDTALSSNHDLQIAFQRIEILRNNIKAANRSMLPNIGLATGSSIRKFGLYTMDGAGNSSAEILPGKPIPVNLPDMYAGLDASWEIDIWGKLRNQKKSATAQYLSGMEGLNFIRSNIVTYIATSYYELIALDNQIDVIRQSIQKQEEAVQVMKLKKESGRTNELAVQQFSAEILNTRVMEKEVLQLITETENRINFLLGRFPQQVQRKKEKPTDKNMQNFSTGVPSQLLTNRPDIRETEYIVQASKFDLKSARAAFFPNINISAAVGFQAFNPEFLFMTPASVAYSLLGSIAAPLINRNGIKARFKSAKANQVAALCNYQKSILNGYVEVVNELSARKNLDSIISLRKQQNEILTQSVETSTELYKSGRATYLEVLLTQQNYLQTRLDLIDASRRLNISSVKLYKSLGGGWR